MEDGKWKVFYDIYNWSTVCWLLANRQRCGPGAAYTTKPDVSVYLMTKEHSHFISNGCGPILLCWRSFPNVEELNKLESFCKYLFKLTYNLEISHNTLLRWQKQNRMHTGHWIIAPKFVKLWQNFSRFVGQLTKVLTREIIVKQKHSATFDQELSFAMNTQRQRGFFEELFVWVVLSLSYPMRRWSYWSHEK